MFYKSKSQVRSEMNDAMAEFLARGGQVEVVKAKKTPKAKMSCKSSRSYQSGTSGMPTGYTRSSFG